MTTIGDNNNNDNDNTAISFGIVPTSRSNNTSTETKLPQRQSRDVRFVYLDYAFSYVISSLIPTLFETILSRSGVDNNSNDDDNSNINNEKKQ
jgi:hypothetical protein